MFWIVAFVALAVLSLLAWVSSFFISLMTIDFDGQEWSDDEDLF